MRLKNLFILDVRFQAKYGFYFLYAVLTAVYIIVLYGGYCSFGKKPAYPVRISGFSHPGGGIYYR